MIIDGQKWSCDACVRGHRVTTCKHHDRPLTRVNRKGRPFSTCSICHHTPCPCPDEHGKLKREAEARSNIHGHHNHGGHHVAKRRCSRPFTGFLPIAPRPAPAPLAAKPTPAPAPALAPTPESISSSSPLLEQHCNSHGSGVGGGNTPIMPPTNPLTTPSPDFLSHPSTIHNTITNITTTDPEHAGAIPFALPPSTTIPDLISSVSSSASSASSVSSSSSSSPSLNSPPSNNTTDDILPLPPLDLPLDLELEMDLPVPVLETHQQQQQQQKHSPSEQPDEEPHPFNDAFSALDDIPLIPMSMPWGGCAPGFAGNYADWSRFWADQEIF